jgi:hypothetical protein
LLTVIGANVLVMKTSSPTLPRWLYRPLRVLIAVFGGLFGARAHDQMWTWFN